MQRPEWTPHRRGLQLVLELLRGTVADWGLPITLPCPPITRGGSLGHSCRLLYKSKGIMAASSALRLTPPTFFCHLDFSASRLMAALRRVCSSRTLTPALHSAYC